VWCVIGDFNSVRRQDERRSLFSASDYSREIRGFNDFYVPMVGRKFTWYKPNGSVKSRIDKVLVSREWLDVWPECKQFILSRTVSDHCALVLKDSKVDWGPKPFRSLDVWQEDSRFKDFVRSKWHSYELQGGSMFIFKEKLKKLKVGLRIWNKEVFGYVKLEGKKMLKKVQELDARDDASDLDEQGREDRRVTLAKYSQFLFKQEAILKQKARHQWLQHGNLNTGFFHSVIKRRRARNGLNGVFVDGLWCDNKEVVKDKVRNFFKSWFDRVEGVSVRLDNAAFSSVSGEENRMLVEAFFEEEVKFAVWSCESSKNPVLMALTLAF